MATPAQTDSPTYEPAAAQLARAAALRRFNRVYVYLPLGLAGLGVLALLGWLSWQVFAAVDEEIGVMTSALADIIVILTLIPLLLLCAIVPLAAVGFVVYRRQQPKREYGRLPTFFWRVDIFLDKARGKTEIALTKTAAPVIRGHALWAYLATIFNNLKKKFARR